MRPLKILCKKNKKLSISQSLKQAKKLKGSIFIMEKPSKELMKEFVNSQRYTSTADIMNSMKELFSDVLQQVMEAELEEKLGYEKSQRILSTFFAYPAEIHKIIYTTNIIEGLNRQFRKITKNKPSFTNDDSLRKMLYLASKNIVDRWTVACRNWDVVSNHLRIMFEDRESA